MNASPSLAPASPSPDLDLVRRIAAGDQAAFVTLMRQHNQTLYRTARSVLRDDHEAEDAVQEAYLLAYRSLAGFRGDAKLSTWLTRIVINVALRRRQRQQRDTALLTEMPEDIDEAFPDLAPDMTPHTPETAASSAELRRLLEAHIDELPEFYRTVFILRGVEEMSVEETAGILDIPEATVRTRFFRARHTLRESLAKDIDFALEDAFSFAGDRCDRIVTGVLAALQHPSQSPNPNGE